jgi:hypothetical protein
VTNGGYVLAGYLVVFGTIITYTVRTLLRGRALSKQVPPEDRRWM